MHDSVLIVEDDRDIADLVELHLHDLGFKLERSANGLEGLERALNTDFALVILDLNLPGLGGMEVCRRIREQDRLTPILMLTAKSDEVDKVLGLEIGADDYMTKPFSVREFSARVKALVRRVEAQQNSQAAAGQLTFGELTVYPERRKVTLRNTGIELTAKEFDLLLMFAGNPGRAYTRQELLDTIWGYQFQGYEHTVNSHINRLRNKIELNPSEPRFIKTVWGIGYRFAEAEEL